MSEHEDPSIARAKDEAHRLGITMDIIPHETSGRATADAARALGTKENLILKMMILVDRKTGRNVGALLRGDERIDQKKLRQVTGLRQLQFASPEEVIRITGYRIGGVPPVAISRCDVRVVSEHVRLASFVFGSGGTEFCAMRLSPREFDKVPDLLIADIRSA